MKVKDWLKKNEGKKVKKQHLIWKEKNKRVKTVGVSLCKSFCVCEAHRSVDVHDHLPSGLVAFTVVGSFLFLLQHAVSGGSVLQRKLAEDFTEPVDADLSHAVGRMTEEQQERMKPRRRKRTSNFPQSSMWESIFYRCNAVFIIVTSRFIPEVSLNCRI